MLEKLYKRLYENKFVKRVFFNKAYEDGFRKFNRYLRQSVDFSEKSEKSMSDRNRSNSQSRHCVAQQDMEEELERVCFGDDSRDYQLESAIAGEHNGRNYAGADNSNR